MLFSKESSLYIGELITNGMFRKGELIGNFFDIMAFQEIKARNGPHFSRERLQVAK